MNNATATSIREEIKTATVKTTREEMVNKEEVPAQFARTFAEAAGARGAVQRATIGGGPAQRAGGILLAQNRR